MATKKKPAAAPAGKPDPRDVAIDRCMEIYSGGIRKAVPPHIIEDLRYFSDCASRGRFISLRALTEFFREERNYTIGKERVGKVCDQHGIKKWWIAQ